MVTDKRRGADAAYLLPLLMGCGAIYGATSVFALPAEVYVYAAIVVTAGALAWRSVVLPTPPPVSLITLVWISLVGFYLAISLLVQWETPQVRYLVGDLAVAVFPLLVLRAYAVRPGWLSRAGPLRLLLGLLLVAAVVASQVGVELSRHVPPSVVLMVGLAHLLVEAGRSVRYRAALGCAYAATTYLAFNSGYRTHLVICLLAILLAMVYRRGLRAAALSVLLVVFLAAMAVSFTDLGQSLTSTFSESRFQSVIAGRPDESLGTRMLEIQDVRSTIAREWSPLQAFVGAGFGSSYVPEMSYIEQNVGANGRVHSIHFGPMLVFYRFGLLGVAAYTLMLVMAVRTLWDVRRGRCQSLLPAVAAAALIGFSVEFLLFNPTVQAPMGWSLGVMLAYRLTASAVDATPPTAPAAPAAPAAPIKEKGTRDDL